MATGSGKSFTAVYFVYRLEKYGGAKRVLFLVDSGDLDSDAVAPNQSAPWPTNNCRLRACCVRINIGPFTNGRNQAIH